MKTFNHKLATISLLALSGIAATNADARVTYNWRVNGFGFSRIDYTVKGADGTVISGNSTTSTGSVTCADGSNSLTWSFGAFWHSDVQAIENKRPGGPYTAASLTDGTYAATSFMGIGSINLANSDQSMGIAAIARNALPDNIPAEYTLSDLISNNIIAPSDVLWSATWTGQGTFTLNQNASHSGISQSDIIIFGSGSMVPTPGAAALFGLGTIIPLARRRR